jgi:hypothetical protein
VFGHDEYMARHWTEDEENFYRSQLIELYINQNKTIEEVGPILNIKWQTVYDRLKRLDVPTHPERSRSAEFFGMMLGDGHLSHFQINVYLGSVKATQWLQNEGLVFDKVKSQVDAPTWIFEKESYMKHCLRGFFDTDGSIYELKFGIQISLTNYSIPLLMSLQQMLIALEYNVSAISSHRLYLTKISDVERFFTEIAPQNPKHNERFEKFIAGYRSKRTGSLVRCEN